MRPFTNFLSVKTGSLLVMLLLFVKAAPGQTSTLEMVKGFGDNPGNLRMFMHIPPHLSATHKMPLIVVLHGCTQSAGIIAAQTGWNKLADTLGLIVLYPQQKMINNPEMCFCWYKRKDITKGRGEDESIMEMIDYLKAYYRIDSGKVFITGLSAGAYMSVAMMATHPETFSAGAIFAGGPYKTSTSVFTAWMAMPGWIHRSPAKWGLKARKQNPGYVGSYPRMIIYQGKNDLVVNRKNGFELVKQWTNLHHIGTEPTEKIKHYAGIRDIERESFRDENKREAVVYYKINKLNHAYLINPGSCIQEGGKRGIFSKDKNYHATWWTAVDFGLTGLQPIEGKLEVGGEEKEVVYAVPAHENSTYSWTFPEGCTVLRGQGTARIAVNWGALPGNVNVEETEKGGCHLTYPTVYVAVRVP